MHHYVAIIWLSESSAAARIATKSMEILDAANYKWKRLITSSGFLMYSQEPVESAMESHILPDNAGAIVGHLFTRTSVSASISAAEARLIADTGGARLRNEYWGNYVAVIHAQQGKNAYSIIRDCSGRIPCYCAKFDDVYFIFSDVRDLKGLPLQLSINERYLRSFISRQPLHIRETGLVGVRELLAGDSLIISSSGDQIQPFWNPRDVASVSPVESYTEARSQLRYLTESSIGAWASLYDRILLNLSGGLDSAIVLGCLHRLGLSERVVGINLYTENTAGDERSYARAAAQMARVPLIERSRVIDGDTFIEKIQAIPADPKPDVAKLIRVLNVDLMNSVADEYDCNTIWTGQGGDHIFLQTSNAYGAADYLIQNALPLGLAPVVYDSARLSRQSVWSVLSAAISYRIHSEIMPQELLAGDGHSFLSSSSDRAQDESASPWRTGSKRLPPGKQFQIDQLSDVLNRHRPIAGLERPYEQHPLISQPLIELTLRVPTYDLLRGGRQRALARDAFADRVPLCILQREDKGSTHDQNRFLIRGSAHFLRTVLLEGKLASLGIIDRTPIERILIHHDTYAVNQVYPLLACLAAELWTRHWPETLTRAAAA